MRMKTTGPILLLTLVLVAALAISPVLGVNGATVTKDFRYTNVNFVPIDPSNGDQLPAQLGDLLPDVNGDDKYDVKYVLKPKDGTVSSTNPGQIYGVIKINGTEIKSLSVNDTFGDQFDVNPAKRGGGVEILIYNRTTELATILTNDLEQVPIVEVDNELNTVSVQIDLDTALSDDEELMIYIKYKTAEKGVIPDESYEFDNEVDINGDGIADTSATIEFV